MLKSQVVGISKKNLDFRKLKNPIVQILRHLKNSNCEEKNSATQIAIYIKTQKLKLWQNSQTIIGTKPKLRDLKNSFGDKIQRPKL